MEYPSLQNTELLINTLEISDKPDKQSREVLTSLYAVTKNAATAVHDKNSDLLDQVLSVEYNLGRYLGPALEQDKIDLGQVDLAVIEKAMQPVLQPH